MRKKSDEIVARSPATVWDATTFSISILEESHGDEIEANLRRDIGMIIEQSKDRGVSLGKSSLWGRLFLGRPLACEGDH